MPLPAGVTTRTYSGTIVGLDGTNATGTLEFRQPHPIRDLDNNVVVGPRQPLTATVTNGAFTIQLPRSTWPYLVRIDTDALKDIYVLAVGTDATTPIEFAATYGTAAHPDLVEFYALLGHLHSLDDLTDVDLAAATDGQVLGRVAGTWTAITPLGGGAGVPDTRQMLAGTGLTGGGDLTADRTYAVVYGTTAGTAAQGNDSRLSDPRTPTAHTHSMSDVTGLQEVLDDTPPRLTVRQAYVTSGNVTLPNTSGAWQALAGFELAVPAAVGDYVELGAHGMRNNTETGFLDIAVISGAAIVRYLATGSSTPAVEGDPGWYPTGPAAPFPNQAAPRGFTVTSGDLNAGNVTFAVVAKAAGAGVLYASADFPFYWQAKNHGPVD
jgi:hypothetical protein